MTEQVDPSSSTSGPLATVPDADEAIERLRQENAQLRAELASLRARQDPAGDYADWESEMAAGIVYSDDHSHTSAKSSWRILKQLAGLSKERMKAGQVRNSDEFDFLPTPSADEAQLEADFIRWGYCLVADAMTPAQIKAAQAGGKKGAEAKLGGYELDSKGSRLGKAPVNALHGLGGGVLFYNIIVINNWPEPNLTVLSGVNARRI